MVAKQSYKVWILILVCMCEISGFDMHPAKCCRALECPKETQTLWRAVQVTGVGRDTGCLQKEPSC